MNKPMGVRTGKIAADYCHLYSTHSRRRNDGVTVRLDGIDLF